MKRQTSKYRRKRGWKNRLSMFLAMLLAATMAFGPVLNVYAETVSELIDVTENEPAETVDESTEEPDEPEPVVEVEPTGNEANPEPETEPGLDPEDPEIDPEIDPELDPEDELEVEDEESEDNEIEIKDNEIEIKDNEDEIEDNEDEIEDNEDEIKDEDDEIEIKDDEEDDESEDEGDEEPTESPAPAPTKTFFGVAPTVVAAPAPATTTDSRWDDSQGTAFNVTGGVSVTGVVQDSNFNQPNINGQGSYPIATGVTIDVVNGSGGAWTLTATKDAVPGSFQIQVDHNMNGEGKTMLYTVTITGAGTWWIGEGNNENPSGVNNAKYGSYTPTHTHDPQYTYAIDKQADVDSYSNVGDTITYTITVTATATCTSNVGTCEGFAPAAPTNVKLSDPMLWETEQTINWEKVDSQNKWTAEVTGTYNVTAANIDVTKVTNTATLSTGESDTVEVPYVTPTPTPHSCGWVYGITKNVTAINGATPATPMPDVTDNDTITYTITVTATCSGTVGTCDGTPGSVTLSDPMLWDDHQQPINWSGSGGAYTATFTETYRVTGNEVGTDGKIRNIAELSTGASDTVEVPYVTPTPTPHSCGWVYGITKAANAQTYNVGKDAYFTITVTAKWDCDADPACLPDPATPPSVWLTDDLADIDEAIDFASETPDADGKYVVEVLASCDTTGYEAGDTLTNTAEIYVTGDKVELLGDDEDDVVVNEPETPHEHGFEYSVEKTAVSAQVNVGEDAEFIITVTATAASDCAGCEITGDEIPKVWLVDELANLEQWVSFDSAAEENGCWSVTLDVSVTATKVETITNEVKIYVADDLGDPLGEDEAEVEVNKPETPHTHGYVYTVTKTADKTEVTAEAEVNFTITIKATPYCSEADCDFSWTADTLTVYLEDYIEGQETELLIDEDVTLAKSEDFEKAITYTLAVGDEDFTNVAKITYEGDKEREDKVGVEVTEGEDPKPPIVTHVHEYGFSITKVAVESEVAAGAAAEFTITVTAIPLACPVDDCDWDGDADLEVRLVDYIEGNEENPEFDKVVTLTKTGDGEYVYTETYEVETDEDATESYEFKNIAKVFYEDEDEAVAEADDKVEVKAEGTTGPTTPPGTEDNDNGGNETPVTTLRVTPVAVDGGETVTIEEDPIPLVEAAPVNDPEPEEESTSEEIIIEEEEIPLALIDFDEEVVLIEIIEEDIPLAGLPKTSDSMDISSLWALVMLSISGMGLGFIGLKKRDEIID